MDEGIIKVTDTHKSLKGKNDQEKNMDPPIDQRY